MVYIPFIPLLDYKNNFSGIKDQEESKTENLLWNTGWSREGKGLKNPSWMSS